MLAVDIGNTFTRVAAFAGETIVGRRSFHTRDLEREALMAALDELDAKSSGDGVWVASVCPGANALVDSAAERCGLRRRFILPGRDRIMPHALSTPETTGVDRLLSAMAAGVRHFPGGPGNGYVVMQCGSAATVDLVDGKGVYRGGYILPGPSLWLSGVAGAAQLPDFSNELPDWKAVWAGDNTRDAIVNGMQLALPIAAASAALFINTRDGATASGGEGPPVVATGGWGEAVLPYVRSARIYDRDLLLHGIRLFALGSA